MSPSKGTMMYLPAGEINKMLYENEVKSQKEKSSMYAPLKVLGKMTNINKISDSYFTKDYSVRKMTTAVSNFKS